MGDEQDGITENASTPTRIVGKSSESSTQAKRQVTTTYEPAADKVKLDVNATGAISTTGFQIAIKITTMLIPDTITAIPATALVSRNSLSIFNKDNNDELYVGPITTTADSVVGITSGWEILAEESLNLDISDGVTLYAIAPAGKTILVKLLETA